MTPRYTWTPASEPPDTRRDVLAWGEDEAFYLAEYIIDPVTNRGWWHVYEYDAPITHWRDVEPPEAGE